MYEAYFNLASAPFAVTPDPRYVYLTKRHREALAHLQYGILQPGGFVQLTGEVGTGKTTLCRCLLEQLPPEADVAVILNPLLGVVGLLATICDELHIQYTSDSLDTIKTLVDALHAHLLDAHGRGRRTVLIIDEAQNLSPAVLEQVRLLTNLETSTEKLLQIILIGQPELKRLLARRELRQLAQRITARYHLMPLSLAETAAYIRHRLRVAGGGPEPVHACRLVPGLPPLGWHSPADQRALRSSPARDIRLGAIARERRDGSAGRPGNPREDSRSALDVAAEMGGRPWRRRTGSCRRGAVGRAGPDRPALEQPAFPIGGGCADACGVGR
ncbi:MAG TPA: AAA family ATPase [Candidatus Methylomirabilis sp.]